MEHRKLIGFHAGQGSHYHGAHDQYVPRVRFGTTPAWSSRRLWAARALLGHRVRLSEFEARLNTLPQFITEIDGLDNIHFIHVKSPHKNALPLIITHGWPGEDRTFEIEFLDAEAEAYCFTFG